MSGSENDHVATRDASSGTAPLKLTADQKSGVRILVIDDERSLRESCRLFLVTEGYSVETASAGTEAADLLRRRSYDIVLVDLHMSEISGMELLRLCLERSPDTLVIVMTGNPSVETSVEALRKGAWDYVPKPFSATHLQILIGRAAHTVLIARESREMEERLGPADSHSEKVHVLGVSPAFRSAIELARRVAKTDASVFITGESGTGKELFASFIHHHSRRSSRTLVALNCAALPEALLESEMFGHRKGAFTGAFRDKSGLLETANGGTMFLDELTEMSKATQAKLLRVIQDGVVRRVGSENAADAVVNVRFIAATNADPEAATKSGRLREDLYYRLRVVPIRIPPLRKRPEDIPLLANHFLQVYWTRHQGRGVAMPTFDDGAIRALRAFPWRGNVRELQNVLEHTVVLLGPGATIGADDIPFISGGHDQPVAIDAPSVPTPTEVRLNGDLASETYHAARERVLADFELRYLTQLVQRADGNMSQAARLAGVDRTTLYRIMEKYSLQRETIMVEGR